MKIFVCARSLGEFEFINSVKLFCGGFDNVKTTIQGILDLDVDAIVAPANSFCEMSGGIDLHYKNYLGSRIETDIQHLIADKYHGELLVGQAEAVKIVTDNTNIKAKYVIFAPTMRVPEYVGHTINSFLAAKAALLKAEELGLESVAIPGLGTGTGGMKPEDFAKQLAEAIRYVLIDKKHLKNPKNLYEEQEFVRGIAPVTWHKLHIVTD